MPRTFAQIKVEIWDEQDFVALDSDAQRLYFVMATRSDLNLVGVLPWHAGRLAQLAKDTTANHITKTAAKLEKTQFIVIDRDTDECLLRSFVRHDGVLTRGPKVAGGVLTAWRSVYSQKLKTSIACEVERTEGLSASVLEILAPILEWAIDTPADTQPEGVSGQPATSNQQPATSIRAVEPRGSRISNDWQPSQGCHDTVGAEYTDLNLPDELAAFKDYWLSKGETRKDWDAAFRNWCRNARKYAAKPSSARRTPGLTDDDYQRAYERLSTLDAIEGRIA